MKITFTVGRVKQNTDFSTSALKEEWSLKVESKDADGMASSRPPSIWKISIRAAPSSAWISAPIAQSKRK